MNGRLETWEAVHRFIFAGNAYFTLRSVPTGNRYTYRVSKHREKDVWFVSLLRGPDNNEDYAYIGCVIAGQFRLSSKSRVTAEAASFKVFSWFFQQAAEVQYNGPVRQDLEVWHDGRCGRCGRKLTVPESVSSGMGPECRAA